MTEAPDFDINDASGDFGECSFTGSAVPTNHSGKWWDMVLMLLRRLVRGVDSGEITLTAVAEQDLLKQTSDLASI